MGIRSLGFRTDLMMLALQGSVIHRREGYRVIRTPQNPTFHWGNFLLLDDPPAPGSVSRWLAVFDAEFPHAEHLAIGVDGTRGETGGQAELAAAGLTAERSTVMTASARDIHPPSRPNADAEFRMLRGESDADWAAALAVMEAGNTDYEPADYRVYAERKLDAMRRMQHDGHGGWFGAFLDGRMVAGLGLFSDGSGVARYQTVDTHPEYRNRGLAGTLVHTAARYGIDQLRTSTLVMVADPGYSAIRVYRSVGFHDTETQTQLSRTP